MITSLVRKEYPYVLECDRTKPVDTQTVFYIIPKTVAGAAETAANYAKVQIERRRAGRKDLDVRALQIADEKEWLQAVKRVQNYGILPKAPGVSEEASSYDHFFLKVENDPTHYKKDEETGLITIVDTIDITDIKNILYSLPPAFQEEIMSAYFDFNALKEGLKN